jgi:nucleotide-binding universal stress UspA family protein
MQAVGNGNSSLVGERLNPRARASVLLKLFRREPFRPSVKRGGRDTMFKHLLLAVDGSPLAESAFRKGIALTREMKSHVTAVRVCPSYHVLTYEVEMLTDTREEYVKAAREEATRYLNGLAEEAGAAGVHCDTTYVVNDHPYMAIIKTAEDKDCDLIVMASHGRRGAQGLLIGSETMKVLTHSRIPVLVYR